MRTSVWVLPDDPQSLGAMEQNAGRVDEVNPVFFNVAADGSLIAHDAANDDRWRQAMRGMHFVPAIQNQVGEEFSASGITAILSDDDARQHHIDQIVATAREYDYDGVEIDYESLPPIRDDFTSFVTALAARLHAEHRVLYVDVDAETSDSGDVFDWPALGAVTDQIKIMAYDRHHADSGPGAIAPLGWIERVAQYADATLPAGKVVFALPWYGYDWSDSGPTVDVGYSDAIRRAAAEGAKIERDNNGELTFAYRGHRVYFQDAQSFAAKVAVLARHASVRGIAAWRAGVEDPEMWSVMFGLRMKHRAAGR